MKRNYYLTESGALIPAVTEDEMHAVDRIAVEEYQLGILQMMENAGRNLAKLAGTFIKEATQKIVILAGTGGNGGGGLCCARHLLNHGYRVDIILVKEPGSYQSAAGTQLTILEASNANIYQASRANSILASAHLIIDALIGYSLKGAPKGSTEDIIRRANQSSLPILSLDLPSGMDATRGDSPGISIQADTVMT